MIVDLGLLDSKLVTVRDALDHKLLDHINTLGPPTLENLARFIFDRLQGCGDITRVTVYRDSCGEACSYRAPKTEPDDERRSARASQKPRARLVRNAARRHLRGVRGDGRCAARRTRRSPTVPAGRFVRTPWSAPITAALPAAAA